MSDATDPRENRVLITVSCGTNNPNRSVRAFHLAQVAHGNGAVAGRRLTNGSTQ